MLTFNFFSSLCPVPCGPSVKTNLDCLSQVLTLSWDATSNAEGYVTIVSNSNNQMSYNTTEPALTINTLECGLDYSLKVMSFSGACVSQHTVLPVSQSKRALGQILSLVSFLIRLVLTYVRCLSLCKINHLKRII